jgi:hypothetical protein
MAERTTVRLPEDLVRRAKRKAAAEGRTLTSLIEDGLRLVVAGANQRTANKRIQPRISRAGGGLMPGVALDDPATLEDLEDLGRVRRMKRGA